MASTLLSTSSLVFTIILHSAVAEVPELLVEGGYEGSVSEHGGLVEVIPEIRARNGPICGYRIVNSHHGKVPFEIFMLDQETGTAQLKARYPLNCEEKRRHVVSIAAVSCSGEVSQSADVHITVADVNEYIPEWSQEEYSASVEEGRMVDNILTLTATDRDCSPSFGEICSYSITSPDQPFRVSSSGVLSTTQPLSSSVSRSHVVSVVAVDCGGRESSPVLVTIVVSPHCSTSWSGVSTSLTYSPGTGPVSLFPRAQLSLCSAAICPVSHIETRVSLHIAQAADACDRDTFTVTNQQKMCGASNSAVDLLPSFSDKAQSWMRDLEPEDGTGYRFDGSNGLVIPESVASHNLGPEFTIATWMKHEAKANDKHHKEHIVCLADDHRKNRHHMSLFIRNCKLVLLLRRDYEEEQRNVFKPAEWRWSLPQVCDNRWHHYAVSVSPDTGAVLHVDGEMWQSRDNNPEIIDDWPLHPAADIKTTLTVGGCWHGSDMKMRHRLTASLAGLSLLTGKREHSQVLKCIVQCSESLQLPASNLLEPGMEMVTNSHGSMVTIDGDNVNNVNTLIRQVAYLNTKEFPAPGKRKLELETTLTCQDGSKKSVPVARTGIIIVSAPQTTITISGTENVTKEYQQFKEGVQILSDISIVLEGGNIKENVDKCSISVFPPLNPDHETIMLPHNLMENLNLFGNMAQDGGNVDITGDNVDNDNFQQVLRQVSYANLKPAYYLNRQFKVVCSRTNLKQSSNEYIQTLTVIHPRPGPMSRSEDVQDAVRPSHHQVSQHSAELPVMLRHVEPKQASNSSVVGLVVMVVCVLASAVIIVMVRAASRRHARETEQEVEMAWDDAALNITVNPLEDAENSCGHGGEKMMEGGVYQDSDDDMYEDTSDEEESDEDDEETTSRHKLEWDDGL